MNEARLPIRPVLSDLDREARQIRAEDPVATTVDEARLAIAERYGATDWERIETACLLAGAIWADDADTVKSIIERDPSLIHEPVLIRKNNWGPPLSYAATAGRANVVDAMLDAGAEDTEYALGRAVLKGHIGIAKRLYEKWGAPHPPDDALGGPAYTLDVAGTEFLFEIGARAVDEYGRRIAPVDVVLETDSRNPVAKHRILELYAENGLELPDTPVMALHRGRIDLLEKHLADDSSVLNRRFSHDEIYPPDLGCHDEVLATQGTPLAGTTLLHLCVDYDEFEIAEWLIARGADVNARASVDIDGFGGHTPLFCTVVSQPNFWMNHSGGAGSSRFTRLLLEAGADPTIRASLKKKLHPGYAPRFDTEKTYEYRDVTASEWGRRFHAQIFVDAESIQLIDDAIGIRRE